MNLIDYIDDYALINDILFALYLLKRCFSSFLSFIFLYSIVQERCISRRVDMVTMNSEKSACRRKPVEKGSSSSGSGKKTSEHVEESDKKNEDVRMNESPDLSPNTPTYNVTASCAEDTPNYLVYKKVTACI